MRSPHVDTARFSADSPGEDPSADRAPPRRCACCADDSTEITPGRHKIWDLDQGLHCSVIGTCLSLDDLRHIIRKADIALAPDAHDYDVHGYFVTQAMKRSHVSKLVHKALDRKYAAQLTRFRRSCTPDELWELWRQAMANGDVAGAYWALMTHKAASPVLRNRAHNEVHMLSHLMGKSSRDDIRRLRKLETECADLSEELAKVRARSDALLQAREARIRMLEAELAAAQSEVNAARVSVRRPTAEKGDGQFGRLRARYATMERRLRVERARARAAEARLTDLAEGRVAGSTEAATTPDMEPTANRALCGRQVCDLRGCALLYVGGYRDTMPRLRAHVEGLQGTFLYHDGGLEMQTPRLPALVSQADAVFCPVGCVSHDACLRLKHLCKRQGKRFVPLRSAGLSGFVAALGAFEPQAPGSSAQAGEGG